MTIGVKVVANVFGYQLKEVAEKLDIKPQTLNTYLSGKRKLPKDKIEKLIEIFPGVKAEYFQKELNKIDELDIQQAHMKFLLEKHDKEFRVTLANSSSVSDEVYNVAEKLMSDEENKKQLLLQKMHLLMSQENSLAEEDNGLYIDYNDFCFDTFNTTSSILQKQELPKLNSLDLVLYILSDESWGTKIDERQYQNKELYQDLRRVLAKHKVIKPNPVTEEEYWDDSLEDEFIKEIKERKQRIK